MKYSINFGNFQTQWEIAQQLLPEFTRVNEERIKYIFEITEEKWLENLHCRIKDKSIKYLLIGEAPPWSENDEVSYFYNNLKGQWCGRICSAFNLSGDINQKLEVLAERNFILIDSLPFALPYSGLRDNPLYQQLVFSSLGFWFGKLKILNLAINLKIAFGLRKNAESIMKLLNNELLLPNNKKKILDDNLICTDRSGYPNPQRLNEIFMLN